MRFLQFAIVTITVNCFVVVDTSVAQSIDGLTISGSVVELKRSTDARPPNAKENEAVWNLDVSLALRNNGTKTILLYSCFDGGDCSVKVEFFKEIIAFDDGGSHTADKAFFVYAEGPSAPFVNWRSTVRSLDAPQPPNGIIALEPGQTIEKRIRLRVKQKFRKAGAKDSIVWENSDRDRDDNSSGSLSVLDAAKFKVLYSFVPMEEVFDCNDAYYRSTLSDMSKCVRPYRDPDLLVNLRKRWRSFGDLPLDSSGTFRITSDSIINLPKSLSEQP